MDTTPVYFFSLEIPIRTVVSASDKYLFEAEGKTVGDYMPATLEEYSDHRGHFLLSLEGGRWIEFEEEPEDSDDE